MTVIATDIRANIDQVRKRIAGACQRVGRSPDEVTIVAVTKTVAPSAIATAFELGIRHFGENRVQEAEAKIRQLSWLEPRPIWPRNCGNKQGMSTAFITKAGRSGMRSWRETRRLPWWFRSMVSCVTALLYRRLSLRLKPER